MLEIERKYLVRSDAYLSLATQCRHIRQGYLPGWDRVTVRIRIIDDEARLTVKGASHDGGVSRSEWEYQIPLADGEEMLVQCAEHILEKDRYYVPHEGYVWEVDRFGRSLEGLVIAEVELRETSIQPPLPSWLGREVTGDMRYYNAMRARADRPLPPTK